MKNHFQVFNFTTLSAKKAEKDMENSPFVSQKIATTFHKLIYGHILKPYLTLQTFFDNCSNNYLTLCKCD